MHATSTALDSGRWPPRRRSVAVAGVLVSSAAFLASSWSKEIWHPVVLQDVLSALGGAMVYSSLTLFLDEWFGQANRPTVYGVQLASKNIVGTGYPFLMHGLLDKLGLHGTLRIWAGIVLATGLLGLVIIPRLPTALGRSRSVPWSFLKHCTFYIYALGNSPFSSGYALPRTYLSQFASSVLHLLHTLSPTMITILNVPEIISCVGFGLLTDKIGVSLTKNTQILASE